MLKHKYFIFFFIAISTLIVFNKEEYNKNMYQYDCFGYYVYLPATIIYHDLGQLKFYDKLDDTHHFFGPGKETYALYPMSTGRVVNKYTIGVSFFQLPLFLVAHAYCRASGTFAADGFSLPYQLAGIFSCILWVAIGLSILGKFLRRYFNESVTTITLICIAFGTNLYNYTCFEQGLSHPYSFVVFAGILYYTDAWYRAGKTKYLLLTGALVGLATIIRPVNIVVAIIPLLWHITSWEDVKRRLALLQSNYKPVLLSFVVFLSVCTIQLLYWKYTTGHFLFYAYVGEHFDFLHPHISDGLFSYRKGWFVYTPIACIGILGIATIKKQSGLTLPIAAFFASIVYIVFSWKMWYYGGGFGCRPLIETLPILAIPLAAIIEKTANAKKATLRATAYTILALLICLNLFQTYQFSLKIIHPDRMSPTYYWKVFGKTSINFDEYEKYLYDEKAYWRERGDI